MKTTEKIETRSYIITLFYSNDKIVKSREKSSRKKALAYIEAHKTHNGAKLVNATIEFVCNTTEKFVME